MGLYPPDFRQQESSWYNRHVSIDRAICGMIRLEICRVSRRRAGESVWSGVVSTLFGVPDQTGPMTGKGHRGPVFVLQTSSWLTAALKLSIMELRID